MAETKRVPLQAQHAGKGWKIARWCGAWLLLNLVQAVQNASQQGDEFVKEFLITHEKV